MMIMKHTYNRLDDVASFGKPCLRAFLDNLGLPTFVSHGFCEAPDGMALEYTLKCCYYQTIAMRIIHMK